MEARESIVSAVREDRLREDVGTGRLKGAELSPRGALTLQSLEKRFGNVVAVEGLNLTVAAGEFVTLLGSSGSGKTTTLLMIAGFERPTSGEIMLDDVPITNVAPHKRSVGIVFQNYALFPHMNVYENIAFPLKMRKLRRGDIAARVSESLALVRLSGYEERYPRELSGGQQQRVALARATVYGPPLLLMDEPLSALDKRLREEMRTEIRQIHKSLGTSIVYVTHDQDEALELSDRIVLLDDGRAEQVGTPQELYERPRTIFAASFLGEANFLAGQVVRRGDDGVVMVELRTGHRVAGTSAEPLSDGQEVLVLVRPEHVELLEDETGSDPSRGMDVRFEEIVYLGDSLRCRGSFQSGEPCTLRVPAERGTAVRSTRGLVRWKPDNATVIALDPKGEKPPSGER